MNLGTGQRLNTTYRQAGKANTNQFMSIWDTRETGTSDSASISLPFISGFPYSCSIDWGDGQTTQLNSSTPGAQSHSYSSPGEYVVTISGSLGGFRFSNGGDSLK
jgi:hypothetical protein